MDLILSDNFRDYSGYFASLRSEIVFWKRFLAIVWVFHRKFRSSKNRIFIWFPFELQEFFQNFRRIPALICFSKAMSFQVKIDLSFTTFFPMSITLVQRFFQINPNIFFKIFQKLLWTFQNIDDSMQLLMNLICSSESTSALVRSIHMIESIGQYSYILPIWDTTKALSISPQDSLD